MSSNQRRVEGTTVACPFVYGSIAYWMGKKADDHATHKWTLYVRGPNMEDMSSFISKVVFTLHPSFAAPIREFSDPPYQVSEFGWGEFEAGIRIFFRDPDEQPIDLIHQIKLYPYPEGMDLKSLNAPPPPQNSKKPVVSEQYDEVVFTDPTESFKRLLMLYSTFSHSSRAADVAGMEHYARFDDTTDLEHLAFIHDHIARETDAAKMRLLQLDSEINQILSDPNAILKTTAAPLPTAPSVFVPASFSSLLAEGILGPDGKQVAVGGEKGAAVKRGASSVTKFTGKSGTAGTAGGGAGGGGSVSMGGAAVGSGSGATWSLKTSTTTGGGGGNSSESASVGSSSLSAASTGPPAALSKKKAQASAAAAAAVKQMELFSSVRM